MRSADSDDGAWYAPAIMHVTKAPLRDRIEFDLHFCKFTLSSSGQVEIGGEPETPVAQEPISLPVNGERTARLS